MNKQLLSETRSQIKTGDLIAFNRRRYNSLTSFVLWSYQKIARAEYSHVGIAMWSGNDLFIVEAIPPRVSITPIEAVEDFYWYSLELRTPEQTMNKFLKRYVGRPYGLFDMLTHYLGMEFNPNSLYCSELASLFYYDIGYILNRDHGHTPDAMASAVRVRSSSDPVHIAVDRGNL